MNTEKERTLVYLTEECYQMLDVNRKKYSDMDDSGYLEMLIRNNASADDLGKYDKGIFKAVQSVFLSRERLQKLLSQESFQDNKAVRECLKKIEDNVEKFREYHLLKYLDMYE